MHLAISMKNMQSNIFATKGRKVQNAISLGGPKGTCKFEDSFSGEHLVPEALESIKKFY